MLVKILKSLEIWKEARRYNPRNLSTDRRLEILERTSASETKFNVLQFQLCRTLQKDLSVVVIKNLFNFFMSRKVHAAKSARNCM